MVKNNGGNKAKKFASKSFNISTRATRFASEKGEVYAIVTKMMGNNICEVLCIDGCQRLCVIRGKFLGKAKRDNILSRGKWVLIGLREWEITKKEKEKCDLLEVYNDTDKEKLIKNTKENFRVFLSVINQDNDIDHDQIQFINTKEEELFNEEDEELFNEEDENEKDENEDDENNENDENDENDILYVEDKEQNNNKKEDISSIIKNMKFVNIDDI